MGDRGKKKAAPQPDPVHLALGVYCCSTCRRPLQLEMVLRADVERRDGTATGFITFEHFCPCQEGAVVQSRSLGSYPSFLALFGAQPKLPYVAPFTWNAVDEDDPTLNRWAWELDQVTDWGEFMLFMEDAADRRAA